eukprot:6671730-Prymnesium_polylepis.1
MAACAWLLLLMSAPCAALRPSAGARLSRRAALASAAALGAAGASLRIAATAAGGGDERSALLAAIARDVGVEEAIEALVPLDPSSGRAATVGALEGRWKLLW